MNFTKYIIGLVLLLSSCVSEPEPPPGTLNKEQMAAILVDVHIAEARAQQAGFRSSDSTQLFYKHLENQILKKYKTDSTQYHKSYRFYIQHVPLMNEIYTAVVDTLTVRQKQLQTTAPPPAAAKPDSLKKAPERKRVKNILNKDIEKKLRKE